jgi:glycogen(starch) synthase
MRLLSIGLLYPPHYIGGYELLCDGVMRAARARGHEVQIVVSDYRAVGPREPDAFPIDRSLRSYLDATARRVAPLGLRESIRLERYNAAVLGRHLHKFAPQVVSWWGMGGMSLTLIELVRRAGVPSVFCVQDHWLSYGPQADSWTRIARRLRLRSLAPVLEPLIGIPIRCELEVAGRFLFNSQYMLDAAAASGFRAPDSAVLTPGVHSRYHPAAPAEPWRGRLLYVGRLDPAKGVDVIISALSELPLDTSLKVVGAGEEAYEEELRRQARSLGVQERVEFAGPRPADALPSAYASVDAVIFPVRWEEPWGLVPLEAMAVGRPVIATSRGGASTYLQDEDNALLMPVDDPQALVAAVRRLADSEELRARLRDGGFRTATEHSAKRYDELVVDELERAGG